MAQDGNNRRKGRWQGFEPGSGGNRSGPPQTGWNRWRVPILYITLALVLLIVLQSLFSSPPGKGTLNDFNSQLKSHEVKEVIITGSSLRWTTRDGKEFTADLPPGYDPTDLTTRLLDQGVKVSGQQPSAWATILFQWIIPIAIFGLIWVFLIRRMAGGGAASALNLGKNRIKIYDRKEMKTTFTDVAGLDEAVEELQEVVEFLKTPKKYQRLGGRIPKGVLLLGPPGCGKTLLARAVAGEAQVPFFYMSGSEFVEMFVGLGAARVRELFSQAKEKAPCLVFLDELDTIGKSRAGALGGSLGSHDEREQTLNQLLVEMDGFDTSKGVIIMAVVAGLERKSRVMSDRERIIVASHEMGHALVAMRVKNADPVHRVSIIPRGAAALGMTMQRPLEDRYLLTEPELLDRLSILMGGRTAEEIVFRQASTGAQNDLEVATNIARAMVTEYGLSQKVGPMSIGHDGFRGRDGGALWPGQKPEVSEQTAQLIDQEVGRLLNEAHDRATVILEGDRDLLDKLSLVLMQREVIEGKELHGYLDGSIPIPDEEQLKRDAEQKASENGKKEASGPDIMLSPSEDGQTTQPIPSRPDFLG